MRGLAAAHGERGDAQTCAVLALLLRRTRLLRGALPREQQLRYVIAYSELLRSSHLFVLAAEVMALTLILTLILTLALAPTLTLDLTLTLALTLTPTR